MRLDHIAYRVSDRIKAIAHFSLLGYTDVDQFTIDFDDGSQARCTVLDSGTKNHVQDPFFEYPPKLFISEGTEGSIVDRWVANRGGTGGVHHLAYEVQDVAETMATWQEKGTKFLSAKPLECEGLIQVFTKPCPVTGVIYEFISFKTADRRGFCEDNVKDLMSSTQGSDE